MKPSDRRCAWGVYGGWSAYGRFPQLKSAIRAALYAEREPTKDGDTSAKMGKDLNMSSAPSKSPPMQAHAMGNPGTLM